MSMSMSTNRAFLVSISMNLSFPTQLENCLSCEHITEIEPNMPSRHHGYSSSQDLLKGSAEVAHVGCCVLFGWILENPVEETSCILRRSMVFIMIPVGCYYANA